MHQIKKIRLWAWHLATTHAVLKGTFISLVKLHFSKLSAPGLAHSVSKLQNMTTCGKSKANNVGIATVCLVGHVVFWVLGGGGDCLGWSTCHLGSLKDICLHLKGPPPVV